MGNDKSAIVRITVNSFSDGGYINTELSMSSDEAKVLLTNIREAMKHPDEIRRAKIASVYLKYRVLKDGVNLKSNDVRSAIGNLVKELNALDPDLNVTDDELLAYGKDLALAAVEKTFG